MSPGIRSYLLGTQSDDRLVGLVRGGSEPAFEALVHRYRKPLLRYCRRLCGSEARAEEALQQALMNVWVALRRGAEVRDVHAWLYRVAHNAAVNSMRGERTVLAEAAPDDLGARRVAALTPAVGVSSLDDVLAVRDAFAGIAALPQMQREVMVRTAVGGHSQEEVASALGISDGAVRGLLHRARCTLRAGMTAVTPTPLLTWAAGGSRPVAGERIAELAAGGGAAGLGGIAAKGGVLAVTAGMAVAGSVIAGHHGHPARHDAPPTSAGGQLSSTAAGWLGGASAEAAVIGALQQGGAGDGRRALAGMGADRRSPSLRGRDVGGGNDRLAQGGRGGGSSGDRLPSLTSGEGISSSGDREGASRDGGSSSTGSSDGSSTQVDSSSSDGGGLSSDGKQSSEGGGSLESQSSDGKSGSLEPESQLQGSSSDGGTLMQSGTSGGSSSGDSSSGSTDGGSSSTTTTTSTSGG